MYNLPTFWLDALVFHLWRRSKAPPEQYMWYCPVARAISHILPCGTANYTTPHLYVLLLWGYKPVNTPLQVLYAWIMHECSNHIQHKGEGRGVLTITCMVSSKCIPPSGVRLLSLTPLSVNSRGPAVVVNVLVDKVVVRWSSWSVLSV